MKTQLIETQPNEKMSISRLYQLAKAASVNAIQYDAKTSKFLLHQVDRAGQVSTTSCQFSELEDRLRQMIDEVIGENLRAVASPEQHV